MTKKQLMEDYSAGKCCIVEESIWLDKRIYALYPNSEKYTIRFDTWLSIEIDFNATKGYCYGETYYFNSEETKRIFQKEYRFIK